MGTSTKKMFNKNNNNNNLVCASGLLFRLWSGLCVFVCVCWFRRQCQPSSSHSFFLSLPFPSSSFIPISWVVFGFFFFSSRKCLSFLLLLLNGRNVVFSRISKKFRVFFILSVFASFSLVFISVDSSYFSCACRRKTLDESACVRAIFRMTYGKVQSISH